MCYKFTSHKKYTEYTTQYTRKKDNVQANYSLRNMKIHSKLCFSHAFFLFKNVKGDRGEYDFSINAYFPSKIKV